MSASHRCSSKLPSAEDRSSHDEGWKRLPESTWFYRAVAAAGPLSHVALIAGWVVTEVGRQPWVVYRVMRTSEAVTGAGGAPAPLFIICPIISVI